MFYIAICDDEEVDRRVLKKYILLSGFSEKEVSFQEFSTGRELLEKISVQTDVVFLDIQMDGMDGKETARALRKRNQKVLLVFFTALASLTYEICKVTPFRYIEKGFRGEKMIEELEEVFAEAKRRKRISKLQVRCDHIQIEIPLRDIVYIERGRKKSIVHLSTNSRLSGQVRECISMDKLEVLAEKLSEHGFGYPHNSYLVNILHIEKHANHELFLDNGEVLNIARSKEKSFMEKYIEEICREG